MGAACVGVVVAAGVGVVAPGVVVPGGVGAATGTGWVTGGVTGSGATGPLRGLARVAGLGAHVAHRAGGGHDEALGLGQALDALGRVELGELDPEGGVLAPDRAGLLVRARDLVVELEQPDVQEDDAGKQHPDAADPPRGRGAAGRGAG